jgi:ribonuclease VapC
MADAVIDSSVLLAVLLREEVADPAAALCSGATISAVNVAEVASRMAEKSVSPQMVEDALDDLTITVVPFDRSDAMTAAALRMPTKHLGLSLGDRACLALAQRLGAAVYTADRRWMEFDTELNIELIR